MGEALSPQQSIIPCYVLGEKERDNMNTDYFFHHFYFTYVFLELCPSI